ncbi:MAG: xanthine dehydrogenase family protein [Spirochaetaceae bacterium]|nr:xanthine dehydrogenase family protein [Spirochaetaceae bacterium]
MCAKRKTSSKKLVDFATSFYTDFELEGMLYAQFIRSPVSSGCIKSVTHPNLPEGYFLITAQDIPGEKTVEILKAEVPVFAQDKICYQGEPIGLIVGPDKKILETLKEEVIILFKKEENTETEVTEVTESESDLFFYDNILAYKNLCSQDDAENIFSEADIQVEGNYSSLIEPFICSEPLGGLAVYKHNVLTLYSSVQWFRQVRQTVSKVLDIEPNKIEIKKTLTAAGNITNIWYSVIVMAQLAIAAKICGKPVKLVFSREEQALYAERGVPVAVSHRTAVNPDGRIKAMIISIILDAGYYNPFVQEIIDRLIISAPGVYELNSYKIEAYVIRSDSPPAPIDLSKIDSQIIFAIENQIYKISKKLGLIPNEVRLLNLNMNNTSPFNFNLHNMDKIIRRVEENSVFRRKFVTNKYSLMQREETKNLPFYVPVRGIGLASAYEGSGFIGSDYYSSSLSMKVTMEKDGNVVIYSYPQSASITSIWINMAASILEISADDIRIDSNFDFESEPKYPNGFFGSIGVMTKLLKNCCTSIQRQRFRHPLPISVSRAVTRHQKKQWDENNFCGTPFFATATGSAAVEVELDPCTLKINIRGIWIVIDAGEIIVPSQAIATIKSEIRIILSALV